MGTLNVKVSAPSSAKAARGNVAKIVHTLSVAHAMALKRVMEAQGTHERSLAQHDADEALEAQLALTAIELYLYNCELEEEGGQPTGAPE